LSRSARRDARRLLGEGEQLLATLAENVIAPAEGQAKALEERRRMIQAELTKPQ